MIKGRIVSLRKIEREDLKRIVDWINNPTTAEQMGIEYPVSEAEEELWFENMLRDKSKLVFAIVENKENRHVGNISLDQIDRRARKGRLSIFIGDESDRSKGFAQDALVVFLKYCFLRLNLHKVYLIVNEDNKAAISLYENCGFSREGLLRDDDFIAGRYVNRIHMSILETDFKKLQDKGTGVSS